MARAAGVGDLPVRIQRLGSFPLAAQIADWYRQGAMLVRPDGREARRWPDYGG
jgi:hypothetical protein